MAFPNFHFQQLEQQRQHQFLQQQAGQQNQQPMPIRNSYTLDSELSPSPPIFSGASVPNQSHPPYIPPFHVAGFAPEGDESGRVGGELLPQWNYAVDRGSKRVKEQDFMENNSQLSSVDFLQARSVSTGLGLSLDHTNRVGSSGESHFLSLLGDEIDRELRKQDAEIDTYLRIQAEQLKRTILDKIQADQLKSISYVEEKLQQALRDKEHELDNINQKNLELEERMEQLALEAGAWQDHAKHTESMIALLKLNLQQVYDQSRDSKEGCGDSEVDDTASCCNGRDLDFHLRRDNSNMKDLMVCKVCRSKDMCMLLFPCKHLCLCKDCESKLSICPLCKCFKMYGIEVHM